MIPNTKEKEKMELNWDTRGDHVGRQRPVLLVDIAKPKGSPLFNAHLWTSSLFCATSRFSLTLSSQLLLPKIQICPEILLLCFFFFCEIQISMLLIIAVFNQSIKEIETHFNYGTVYLIFSLLYTHLTRKILHDNF